MESFLVQDKLRELRQHLQLLSGRRDLAEHDAFVQFFVRIIPRLFGAERCGIFFCDTSQGTIRSKYGTELNEGEVEVNSESSVAGRVFQSGRSMIDNHLEFYPDIQKEILEKTGFQVENMLCSPIRAKVDSGITGVIQVLNSPVGFVDGDVKLLEEIGQHIADALKSIALSENLAHSSSDLENALGEFDSFLQGNQSFLATDPSMHEVLRTVEAVCQTPASVLILGENGTGKEVVARLIHSKGGGSDAPFVAVNCAAIPETLLESEFFGYERGAFTGANRTRGGFFEQAYGGVLFLDEVAELPLTLQAKLLRVLQEKEGRRLGGEGLIQYNFRLLTATNRDLEKMVKDGEFREDLYYRLFSISLKIPPLRKRPRDISVLANRFFQDICAAWGKSLAGLDRTLIEVFEKFDWPGNVRQLRREIERMVTLTPAGEWLSLEVASPELVKAASLTRRSRYVESQTLKTQIRGYERELIAQALELHGNNKEQTARALGITRQALYYKLKD